MAEIAYSIFDGQQWNSRRGLARFARQLRRHLQAVGWQDQPVPFPAWSSSVGRILISEFVEPYQHRRLQPDIAFYPFNVLPSWLPAGRSLRVLVLHDVLFLAPENKGMGNRYRRLKLNHSLANTDLILTVSEASRAAIQNLLSRDIPILIIPNCLAESFANLSPVPKQPGAGPISILHFGGHVSSKNTFALMEAVAQLVKDGVPVRLDIAAMAGHAPLMERWRSAVNLPHGSLQILPVLNDAQLIEAYTQSTLHAMPSTGEGFGIPVIEAARTGTLNVLTPLPVFQEMMGPGAIYAEGFDARAIAAAIQSALATDPRTLTEHAYLQTHRYTFESIHENYAVPALEKIAMLASTKTNSVSMTPVSKAAPKTGPSSIAALWSRDVATDRLAGRPRIIQAVRQVMSDMGPVEHLRLANLIEQHNIGAIAWTLRTALGDLLRGRLPSMQCLLFADGVNHRQLREQLRDSGPATLYCDGVRSYYFLRRLGTTGKQMRIVVDLDDLMSRRMDLLRTSGLGLSLGYLQGRAPAWAVQLLQKPFFAYVIASWEHAALLRVENELGNLANAVVLLSPMEGKELADRYRNLGTKARVAVIPPPSEIAASPQVYRRFERFIFIGTDTLPQNHSTIASLIQIWSRLKPSAALHIYGSMSHSWPQTEGVKFQGYAPSLSDVYSEGSVLLAPGILRGGVKTKVIEAFANGCAVIGNSVTFEGLNLTGYPFLLDNEKQMESIVQNPEAYLEAFRNAAVTGQECIASGFQWNDFAKAWRDILEPQDDVRRKASS